MSHSDNYIASKERDELEEKILKEYTKAPGWLPIPTFDMVQCGYPLPDHGEMVERSYGGTNEKDELLPPTGMWCKAEDVQNLFSLLVKVAAREQRYATSDAINARILPRDSVSFVAGFVLNTSAPDPDAVLKLVSELMQQRPFKKTRSNPDE